MSELDEFRATVIPRQVEAETALHNGDPEPRLALWSAQDPVTLFGAGSPRSSGRAEVSRVSRWIASRMSGVRDYQLEVVAAGEWKIVHRHGDYPPADQSRPGETATRS